MEEMNPAAKESHPGHRLVNADEWPAIASHLGLSIREWEVAVLLFQGHTRLTIARQLNIGARTVRQYVEQIHRKLAAEDRVQLVLLIIEVRDRLRGHDQTRSA